MKIINLLIAMSFILGTSSLNAQTDMVMLRPIDFSPGMTGNKESCISLSARNMNFSSELISYNTSLSYEFMSQKLKGGIGISYTSSLVNFRSFSNILGKSTSQRLNVVYAPKIVIRKKIQFSPFIKLSAMHINNSTFVNLFEQDIQSMPLAIFEKKNVLALSTGFLINQRRWFFGAETYGFNTYLFENRPIAYSIGFKYQTGVFLNFTSNRKYGVSFMLAQDFANAQGRLFNANNSVFAILKLDKISALFSYHSDFFGSLTPSSIRVGLGYQPSKRMKIGYSIKVNHDYWFRSNDHQIGFQYILKKKDDTPFFAG